MKSIEFSEILTEVLARGYELRGIECKGPGSRKNKPYFAKVLRAMIGMANRRDGGFIIIGIEDKGLKPIGLNETDLDTWKYDHVGDAVAPYVEPSITFELEIHEFKDMKFVLLIVKEFDSIPILCRKNYPDILREGACYVRSRRKPETVEIPTQEDMRDLLDLATEKALRRFSSQAKAAGVKFPPDKRETDTESFDIQIRGLL